MKKILFLLCLFLILPSMGLAGTAFYVDPTASGGTHVGTYANPWQTLAQVTAHSFSTGDDIYFKAGTTLSVPATQYLNINWNGTSGDHVVIGAYYGDGLFGLNGGARPILDGQNAAPAHDSGVGMIHKENYCPWVCTKENAYLEVKDIKISNSGEKGIIGQGISHFTVQNCYIYRAWTSVGIMVARSDDFLIDGNTIDECRTNHSDNSAALTITDSGNNYTTCNGILTNNTLLNSGHEGIGIYQRAYDIVVANNNVHNVYQGPGIYFGNQVHDVVVANNIVYTSSDRATWVSWQPGIMFDEESYPGQTTNINCMGGSYGIVITGNVVVATNAGIVLSKGLITTDPYAAPNWCWPGNVTVLEDRFSIYNNTIIDSFDGGAYHGKYNFDFEGFSNNSGWSNISIKNNISYAITAGVEHSLLYSPFGVTWDHNLFNTAVSGNAATNSIIAAPGLNKTSGWQSLTSGALTFTSTDYLPASSNSAIVDTGTWLTTVTTGVTGTSVVVANSEYFGRTLYFGIDNNNDGAIDFIVQVASVNSANSTVTFTTSHTYTTGAHIYRAVSASVAFYGNGPDIGAYEFPLTAAPQVAAPVISPNGAEFDTSQSITLTTTTIGADIYYTINGTTPTSGSTHYTTPFSITDAASVKAIGILTGYTDSTIASAVFTKNAGQAPYGGTAWAVPGNIYAKDYDTGGEGVAYHDLSSGNTGTVYRTDDVDIWYNGAEGYYVGSLETGEWMEYTVNVASTATYQINVRAATSLSSRTMHIEQDGVDKTGSIAIPNTGAYYNFNVVSANADLTVGTHILKVVIDNGGFNLLRLNIVASGTSTPGTPANFVILKDNTSPTQPSGLMSIHVGWSAVSGADGYVIYYGSETGNYTRTYTVTETNGTYYGIDPTLPIFLSCRAYTGILFSNYATEIECKTVTVTIPSVGSVMDWLPIQAIEKSGNHTVTITPTSGYGVTAMKTDGAWADGTTPTKTFTNVTADHALEVVVQRLFTQRY